MWDLDYINFLLATPRVVSATEAERVQPEEPRRAAHDAFTRLLHRLEPDTTPLWREAEFLVDRTRGLLVIDDSTLDKPYSYEIALVHRHWSGKHRRVVSGINLASLVWSDERHAIPCDYRLFDAPNDGLTKNDHFRAMLETARKRGFTPEYVCFDNWYSSLEKTALLREWASQSGVPWTYWSALKEPAELQRRRLAATIRGRPASATGPGFPSWSELWDDIATLVRDDRRILILDELPWAIEADPALLSALQYAWDIHFQQSNLILVLCGSHIRTMESLLSRQTPLFGRLTAQYQLQPLPFGVLREFFPAWAADASLSENIRRNILGPTSVALFEIELLLSDEVATSAPTSPCSTRSARAPTRSRTFPTPRSQRRPT